jgi:hypothetical protein
MRRPGVEIHAEFGKLSRLRPVDLHFTSDVINYRPPGQGDWTMIREVDE